MKTETTIHNSDRHGESRDDAARLKREERKDFQSYIWSAGLALLLTVVPFALVHWSLIPKLPLLVAIAVFGLTQTIVHIRFFLHVGLRQKREDLQLMLFSALLLVIMVAGTLWIMANLAMRMGMSAAN